MKWAPSILDVSAFLLIFAQTFLSIEHSQMEINLNETGGGGGGGEILVTKKKKKFFITLFLLPAHK